MKALAVSHAAKTSSSNNNTGSTHTEKKPSQAARANLVDMSAEDSTSTLTQSPSTIHRSSSHESHLRNKVNQLGEQIVPQSLDSTSNSNSNQHLSKSSLLDCGGLDATSRRLSEESEMSSKCTSGQASPNLQSPTHLSSSYKVNGAFLVEDPNKSIK